MEPYPGEPPEKPRQPTDALLARDFYDLEAISAEAMALIEARPSIEHREMANESFNNARTALFEELTASGHLSPVEFEGEMYVVLEQILERLVNGWSDNYPLWEQERRFWEIREALIIKRVWRDIQSGALPADIMIITQSDYAQEADERWAHRIGYRALNRKGFNRVIHFEQDNQANWKLVMEQISRSNSNDGSSLQLLNNIGQAQLGDYQSGVVLSQQMLARRVAFPDGVVDVQRALDSYGGPFVRYGDDIRSTHRDHPDYADIRQVSRQRESVAGEHIQRLAVVEAQLQAKFKNGEISYEQKLTKYRREQTKIVNEICLLDPSYARDARGELSAKHFEKAALAMAMGRHDEGQMHLAQALYSIDPRAAAVCGGLGLNRDGNGLNEEGQDIYQNALNSRESWQWKTGLCIVKSCPTRPSKTKVGPCSVCKGCQAKFDKGEDPTKIATVEYPPKRANVISLFAKKEKVSEPKPIPQAA